MTVRKPYPGKLVAASEHGGPLPVWWRWGIAGFAVLILVATIVAVDLHLSRPLPQRLLVQPLRTSTFHQEVQGAGVVDAQLVSTSFPVPGRVAEINVQEGQTVSLHQRLAVLDDAVLRGNVQTLLGTLQASQERLHAEEGRHAATLARLQLELQQAQTAWQNARRVYDAGGLARVDLDALDGKRQDALLSIQEESATFTANLSAIQQQQLQTRQALQQARDNLTNDLLISPVDGVVSRIGLVRGVSSEGDSIELVKRSTLRVRVDLPEASSADVRVGDAVSMTLSTSERPLQGTVERVGVVASSSQSGNAVVPVYVHVTGSDAPLKSGLSVDATITTLVIHHAVTVPIEAIVQDSNQTVVWTVDARDRLQRRRITVLARNVNDAAVRGLQAGERLVRTPTDSLKSGVEVDASDAR